MGLKGAGALVSATAAKGSGAAAKGSGAPPQNRHSLQRQNSSKPENFLLFSSGALLLAGFLLLPDTLTPDSVGARCRRSTHSSPRYDFSLFLSATSWFCSVTNDADSPSVVRYATARLGYYFEKKEEYFGMPVTPLDLNSGM